MHEVCRTLISVALVVGVPTCAALWLPDHVVSAIPVGTIAALFVNLDRLKRLKAAGVEAELRSAVNQAYATVQQIRSLAKPLIHLGVLTLSRDDRLAPLGGRQKHQMRDQFEVLGKSLSVWDEDLQKSSEEFYHLHARDHLNRIAMRLRAYPMMNDQRLQRVKRMLELARDQMPSKDDVQATLGDLAKQLDLPDLLEDYDYYRKTKCYRRDDSWS